MIDWNMYSQLSPDWVIFGLGVAVGVGLIAVMALVFITFDK